MSQIIAGIYEIEQQIGAGGGGVVYLGRHLRLDKQVVLKADKRTLNTKPEALRREVDMLKGLSHTYIPQVYDFVQQDGVVYTVMDFIEGESLDKILKRGQLPSQPQLIAWACELLEALAYLHSRPPHGILHGDIKPANIMLRPNGSICLIDYNIALALGEDGAVRVGHSRGYASPEHYGEEFSPASSGSFFLRRLKDQSEEDTVAMESSDSAMETMRMPGGKGQAESYGSGNTASRHLVKLDVRSDIYSLGATLYHLLSGERPETRATEVVPLGPDICSPAVWSIIQKAMAPSPELRYQSAGEMLQAFRQLHRKDRRVLRHRRRMIVCAAGIGSLFLAGGVSAFVGLKQIEQQKEALALAEYSENALAEGKITEAVSRALQAIPEEGDLLSAPVTAQARKALTDSLGVYELSDGFYSFNTVELPSAPFKILSSPGGSYFAAVYSGEAAVFSCEDGSRIASFPIQNSALSDLLFVDENRIVYAGEKGITAYDLEKKRELWRGEAATTLAVSGNGEQIAAVNKDEERVVFYRMGDGEKTGERSFEGKHLSAAVNDIFADPDDSILALNEDGSFLAVTFSDGGLSILDTDDPQGDLILYDESEYLHFDGGFCGDYLAFIANGNNSSQFGLINVKEAFYAGGYESNQPFALEAHKGGICLANGNVLVRLEPEKLEETELAYTGQANITAFSESEGYVLTATDDRGFSFFDSGAHEISKETGKEQWDFVTLSGKCAVLGNRDQKFLRMMRLEEHSEENVFSYDARYDHDEARISADGNTAMLFGYKSFRIYDKEGDVVTEKSLPLPEQIYDQQFERKEKQSWLKVIWYDGMVRRYSAADGTLISETKEEPPDESLEEELETEHYRIVSRLHETPRVYDQDSGRFLGELEKEDYLTYATETEEGLITEYVRSDGSRYGLLLDQNLEITAYFPSLCDIWDESLIFDYQSGNLRKSRIYSLQELKNLGVIYVTEGKESMK